MTLLSPGFLAAAALALPLVAIFLLKVRPRRRPVTAYFLWDRVFVEKKSSALFNKLRDALSLVLLLAALSAAVLAAARPRPDNADTRDLLVVLDDSASMDALSGSGFGSGYDRAIDRAKREAHTLLASVSGQRRGAVATLSDGLRMRQFLTDDRRALRRAIDAVQPSSLPSREAAAAPLTGLAELGEQLRVVVITDAEPGSLGIPDGIDVIPIADHRDGVTKPASNAGITAAEIVRYPNTDEIGIFVRITATDDLAGTAAEIVVERGDSPIKLVPVTLGTPSDRPRGSGDEATITIVTTARGPAGPYRIRLHLTERGPDAMPADATAAVVAHAPEPVLVGVSDSARYFFENAVLAFQQSEGILRLAADGETPDLRLDRGIENGPSRLGSIVFAPNEGSRWVLSQGDMIPTPIPRLVAANHPAFRFVPVESLPFDGATDVTLPEGAAVLVEDQSGVPLVWQIRSPAGTGEAQGLVFNADPARNDFVLSPYFPLIVRGAAAYLSGRGERPRSAYPTGNHAEIPGLSPQATATLTGPTTADVIAAAEQDAIAGEPDDPQAARMRTVAFGERPRLEEPGFYRAETPNGETLLAASLLHPGETRVEAPDELPPVDGLQRGSPWWARLALLALGLLVLEEILYHRRKVG